MFASECSGVVGPHALTVTRPDNCLGLLRKEEYRLSEKSDCGLKKVLQHLEDQSCGKRAPVITVHMLSHKGLPVRE